MFVHPETDQLPHEPRRVRAASAPFALRLVGELLLSALLIVGTLPLWPLFLLGWAVWGWPPHLSRPRQLARYVHTIRSARPPAPGIPPLSRAYLLLLVLRNISRPPITGTAWFIDELVFGRALDRVSLDSPLIVLSAARSGSTQISHYLEDDPRLAAPCVLQILAPYLWVWKLVVPTLGRLVRPATLQQVFDHLVTEEFRQRHEGNPLRTDTLEVMFAFTRIERLALLLGPRALRRDFLPARSEGQDRLLWEQDFVDYIDRLGRKTLLFAGPAPDGRPRRLFFKGHFQASDEALAARFPDAHFLTVVRHPVTRLKSLVNHIHGAEVVPALGATPWAWLAAAAPEGEADYCRREQAWFGDGDDPQRIVIRFQDYVHDLEGTMQHIYGRVFGDTVLPPHVPREHAPRERKNYRVDRGLEELGIDVDAYAASLTDYIAWIQPGTPNSTPEPRSSAS